MAESSENLEIKIGVEYNGKGANEAKKAIENIGEAAKKGSGAVSRFGSALATLKINALIDLSLKASEALKGLFGVFSEGVAINSQFEKINTKLQSLIFTADKSANIDPFEKWSASGKIAEKISDELKNLSLKTGFGAFDLSEAFGSFFSTASAHLSTDEAVKVFEKLAYTAKISGADINTLKVTLDNVGAGIIQTNNDFGRFLGSLGLGTENLKKAIESGEYASLLLEKLAPFEEASKMAGASLDDIKNQFKANIDEVKQIVSEPIFDALKTSLDELNKGANFENLKEGLGSVSEEFAKLLKQTLTPENLNALLDSISALTGGVGSLISALQTLSDWVAPDWFFGKKDAGISDVIKTAQTGLRELGDILFDFNPFDEKQGFDKAINDIKSRAEYELKALGAVFENTEFKGFEIPVDIDDFDSAVGIARARYDELAKIYDDLQNLSVKDQKDLYLADPNYMKNFKKELNLAYEALMSLQNYEGAQALAQDKLEAQELAREAQEAKNAYRQAEISRLQGYLATNEARYKAHEKTINQLMREEERLSAKIKGELEAQNATRQKYANQRADLNANYDEALRKSSQSGMSDTGRYADDMQAFRKAIEEANEALKNSDFSAYERALSLAKSINEEWKGEQVEGTSNGLEAYKSRLEELRNLELGAVDSKENADMQAHTQKIALLGEELAAVQANIEAEKAFFAEYTAKAQELQALLNTATNSEHSVSINDTEAKSAINELKKDTSSTHTVHVKEVKTEAKASGGIIGAFKRRRGKIAGHDLSGRDDIPALLTRGEFVQNVRAVDYYGEGFMRALNARAIPKSALPRFATGGLVTTKANTDFIKEITNSSADVKELAEKLLAQFRAERGNTIQKWLETARKWAKIYPKYMKVAPNGYKFDAVGLAKELIAKGEMGSDINTLSKGFGGGAGAHTTSRNVNLNFNVGANQSYAVLSDEETANALERYFKGLGA